MHIDVWIWRRATATVTVALQHSGVLTTRRLVLT